MIPKCYQDGRHLETGAAHAAFVICFQAGVIAAMQRPDLPCMYLASHELESISIIAVVVIIVVVIVVVVVIIIVVIIISIIIIIINSIMQGFWQNAWWTSTVKDIEADDTVVCLSDATPVYPEGEEWEVERENLRAGHPQEASGFGMLNLDSAPVAVHKTAWGSVALLLVMILTYTTLCCAVLCCSLLSKIQLIKRFRWLIQTQHISLA